MDWLVVAAPLLAELRNLRRPPRSRLDGKLRVYIPARGFDEPLAVTARHAVVVRDRDEECVERNCLRVDTVGKAAAVEGALRASDCEYAALFDSDVYFTPLDAASLAEAAGDGVATSYRLLYGRGFWGWVAAAASDVGFTLMGLSRFIWGGAVAGRADTLRAIYSGASRALSDDMYATRAAKRLGVPIRFLYLRLVGPAPAETPRGVFKRLVRQFAIASRQGPLLVKVGVALLAGWLALWAAYPYMFLVSALAGYLRRLALRAPCPPVYIPAAMLAPLFILAAAVSSFLIKEVEWRGARFKL